MKGTSIKLKIQRLDKGLPMPVYAYKGDAAFDLYARETIVLKSGERFAVPTGVAMEIPDGYVGLIWDKSGIGIKEGIKTLGGVIDSAYRGEILIGVVNLSKNSYTFSRGHKVAQMIIQKKETVVIEEIDELSNSHRGKKGFGSSGK
jgi:dUTP pyrophosphatase